MTVKRTRRCGLCIHWTRDRQWQPRQYYGDCAAKQIGNVHSNAGACERFQAKGEDEPHPERDWHYWIKAVQAHFLNLTGQEVRQVFPTIHLHERFEAGHQPEVIGAAYADLYRLMQRIERTEVNR